jgi:hypothetical protein
MSSSVELILLKCPQCSTPVPAEEDEVAWVCDTCGTGVQLTDSGLARLNVQWAASSEGARVERWLPFWAFSGTVRFHQRLNYGGSAAPDDLWQAPRRLFVPAFACPLAQLQALGGDLTRRQPALQAAPPAGPLQGCTVLPDDAARAVEFVVVSIEAARKDKLRSIQFSLDVGPPELWLLPFSADRLLL